MNKENSTNESKPGLTSGQKQTIKRYLVYGLLFLIFSLCILLIYKPSTDKKDKTNGVHGFNTTIPMPKDETIISDKQRAYEQAQNQQKQEERMHTLQNFANILQKDVTDKIVTDYSLKKTRQGRYSTFGAGVYQESPIKTSAVAYKTISHNLETFYANQKIDTTREHLKNEIEMLKAKLVSDENQRSTLDEQMALMEKSYQIAARYLPQMQSQAKTSQVTDNSTHKSELTPVAPSKEKIVSALPQQRNDSDSYMQNVVQNSGFITITDTLQKKNGNEIQACVYGKQTLMDGQNVRLRLLTPILADNVLIDRNTILSGESKLVGERMEIIITSFEFHGTIFPVQLRVYDTDGQPGIYIPNTMGMNAVKEIAANVGTGAGANISFTSNPGQQLVADMGRNLIQGTSQLFARRLREVKIHLKAGYKVLLLSEHK